MVNKEVYAYKRKDNIDGFHYGASNIEGLYNHSLVINKQKLNKKQIHQIAQIQKKKLGWYYKEQKLLRSFFNKDAIF